MRTLIAFSAVLFSIDGAELAQLVAAFFIAGAVFHYQTKEQTK